MKKTTLFIIGIFIIMLFVGLNRFFMRATQEEEIDNGRQEESVVFEEREPVAKIMEFDELTRRMQRDPSRKFYMNMIFADGKEVARFKSKGEEIFDVEGEIPDGEVKFKNVTDGTYGVENFEDGKREGNYKEYAPNGQLRLEKEYFWGKLVTAKEFYPTGQLRMEVDYSDALPLTEGKEVGRGKIFFKDGVLMYEWYLTAGDMNRYKKMYNYRGELVEIDYFNGDGNLVSKKRIPVNSAE